MCAMIALGLASTAISAAGMVMQGKQAEAMSEYQAKAYGQQAAADQQASAYEASRERHKQELLQAQARAQVGASGVALAGSPTEVLVANAREGELDLQAIRYGSQLRQNNLNTQAAIARFSGKQAKTASYIGAAGTAVSGFMSTYERAVQFGQNPFSG
jgi:hypothetical protein